MEQNFVPENVWGNGSQRRKEKKHITGKVDLLNENVNYVKKYFIYLVTQLEKGKEIIVQENVHPLFSVAKIVLHGKVAELKEFAKYAIKSFIHFLR